MKDVTNFRQLEKRRKNVYHSEKKNLLIVEGKARKVDVVVWTEEQREKDREKINKEW